jgi:hypothetical protein
MKIKKDTEVKRYLIPTRVSPKGIGRLGISWFGFTLRF